MQHRLRRRGRQALAGLAVAAAALAALPAQDRIPVALDTPQEPTRTAEIGPAMVHEPLWLSADQTFHQPITDDAPDFRPTEEVLDEDGNVVGTRPVGDPYTLAFAGGTWRPAPGIDPRLETARRSDPAGHSFAYVMVSGRLADESKRAAFVARGGEILGTHTWQSWVARVPHAAIPGLAELPFVRWIGYPQDAQKVEPHLAERLLEGDGTEGLEITVSVHASDLDDRSRTVELGTRTTHDDDRQLEEATHTTTIPNGPIQQALEDAGFRFEEYHEVADVFVFHGRVARHAVARLAALDEVAFLELRLAPELQDDTSMSMIGVDRVRSSYGGSGITVGIVDSGVQGSSGRHFDLNKNFVGWSNVPGGSPFVDGHGHGTHVTGTVGGSGSVDVRYKGAAPDIGDYGYSRVFIGRLFDDTGAPHGSFASLYAAMSNGYTAGGETSPKPPVINNSWGTPPSTNQWYGTESAPRTVDGYVYDHRQLHVFAAGNRGVGVLLEGTAKNCLTVGSVDDYSDTSTAAGAMSSFSQYGTRDNRRKPEVVAPGSSITSTSNLSQRGYTNKSGTSMAAPHVTGTLIGLIDHSSTFNLRPQNMKATAAATAEWWSNPGSSSGWFGSQGGFGLINAYRMHWSTSNWSLWNGVRSTPISSSGNWFYWEIQAPTDLEAMKAVVTWIEPAASAGATQARVNDLRCYVDVEPFDSAGNAGDFSLASGIENMLSFASRTASFIDSARGKRIRFKVFGQSVSSACYPALSVVAYRDDTYVAGPVHVLSVSDDVIRPGTEIVATARIREAVGLGEFETARVDPSFSPFVTLEMARTSAEGDVYSYPVGIGYPSSPYPSLTGEVVLGRGTDRSVRYTLRAPTNSGTFTLSTSAAASPSPQPATNSVQVCVDGLAPSGIANLRSSSHTASRWSNDRNVRFLWSAANDNGCAGLDGLAYAWGRGDPADPTAVNMSGAATSTSFTASDTPAASGGYMFELRAIDNVDNRGAVARFGPVLIDTVAPVLTSVELGGGASHTAILGVQVRVAASDDNSGLDRIRYSADNSNWSGWQVYAASRGVDLSAFGGNANEGTKRLYVQVRDTAGNVSNIRSDTIQYLRAPLISGSPVRTTTTVGNTPLVLTGTDFQGVNEIEFGTLAFASRNERGFADGWFRIVSDTRIEIFVPQGLAAGSYPIRLVNPAGRSNSRNAQLVYPTSRILATARSLSVGDDQIWFTHHGGASGNLASYLVLSPFRQPSVLPGVVSLDIGLNFASVFLIEPAARHDATTGAARIGPLRAGSPLRGATWYAQAMQLDLGSPGSTPIPVTNVAATSYR